MTHLTAEELEIRARALSWLRYKHGSDAVFPLNDEYVATLMAGFVVVELEAARRELAGRWVSCSERLPEDDSRVLAAVPFTNTASGVVETWVGECLFYSGGEDSGQNIFTDSEGNEYEGDEVDGWQPLPSPPAQTKETER